MKDNLRSDSRYITPCLNLSVANIYREYRFESDFINQYLSTFIEILGMKLKSKSNFAINTPLNHRYDHIDVNLDSMIYNDMDIIGLMNRLSIIISFFA